MKLIGVQNKRDDAQVIVLGRELSAKLADAKLFMVIAPYKHLSNLQRLGVVLLVARC
jgi:hypothetical protein